MKRLTAHRFLVASWIGLTLMVAACQRAPQPPQDMENVEPDIREIVINGQSFFYEVVDGLAIYQGDIILGDADELESRIATQGIAADEVCWFLVTECDFSRWPNAVIPYKISEYPWYTFSDNTRTAILNAIEHWERYTTITFRPATKQDEDYVIFQPSSGSSSEIGKMGGGQYINLSTDASLGTIIHEIGHTVGLHHEHNRCDRDEYIVVNERNLTSYGKLQFALPLGLGFLGDLATCSSATDYGPYDFASIMHYPQFGSEAVAVDPSKAVFGIKYGAMVPPGIAIGQRDGLSGGDIATVETIYESSRHPANVKIGLSNGSEFKTIDGAFFANRHSKVLTGDFTGDGKDDILLVDVASNGTNRNTLWVISVNGTRFTIKDWAVWDTSIFTKFLVGDFNGDGRDDVMKFDVPLNSGRLGLWVGLSDGSKFVDTGTEWARWNMSRHMQVQAGDFNCDGKTDVMRYDVIPGSPGYRGVFLGLSNGSRFIDQQWGTVSTSTESKVLTGDFDKNCGADTVHFQVPRTGTQAAQSLKVGVWTGSQFATSDWASWHTDVWIKPLIGDFDGDGLDDVMKFDVDREASSPAGLWVGLSTGANFHKYQASSRWALWWNTRYMKVLAGDFNGDGRDDVMKFDVPASGTYTERLWVGLSDGKQFNAGNPWAYWPSSRHSKIAAGDFNGDGKRDVFHINVP